MEPQTEITNSSVLGKSPRGRTKKWPSVLIAICGLISMIFGLYAYMISSWIDPIDWSVETKHAIMQGGLTVASGGFLLFGLSLLAAILWWLGFRWSRFIILVLFALDVIYIAIVILIYSWAMF
jgi:hypothetical protein